MQTDKQKLSQLARKLATSVTGDYDGRWCFFAGFAFVLNGVEKKTYDIDVLTRDQETYQYMTALLHQLGLRLMAATSDFSSFKIDPASQSATKDLTLDLLCITSQWLKPLGGMWTKLESKKVEGTLLPVLRPIYLILLKILVNSHRQPGDKKKEQDFRDVQQLMAKRRITDTQMIKEGVNQGLEDLTRKFLDKLKSMKI
jgi:hypothetical protein